jgi:hypothetical protein
VEHLCLPFEDQQAPTTATVLRFFAVADAAPGPVAIHCAGGLGRTGTLAALYLMRRCGFTAREAMGWLRVMRPGSVIGEQQHYLVAVERGLHESLTLPPPTGPPLPGAAHKPFPSPARTPPSSARAAAVAAPSRSSYPSPSPQPSPLALIEPASCCYRSDGLAASRLAAVSLWRSSKASAMRPMPAGRGGTLGLLKI